MVYVDNGSTDGTDVFLESFVSAGVRVIERPHATIAALRNAGAAAGAGGYLAFLDADCAIEETYFDEALAVLAESGAAATGSEVFVPDHPHWIERVLHELHYMGRERDAIYINSANFFVTRAAFCTVGGFRTDLTTGEDADIGHRLVAAGFRIRESPRVKAVHYGNPTSIGEYYRRTVWHGLGMFATVNRSRLDRPTAMLGVHGLATLVGLLLLATPTFPFASRLLAAVALQLLVPIVTVIFRILQTRRIPSPGAAILLYWLYYWARMQSLWLLATGRSTRFSKK